MGDLIQLLVSGMATGAIYALAALGFTLLWQAAGVINFAQGEFVMLPAFSMLFFIAGGSPLWLAFLLTCVLSMIAYEALMGQAQQVTLAAQAQTNAAVFRDQVGRRLTFVCPANVNINQDVYGTDVYTDTSPICAAAAHAGVFTHGTSTAVTIVMEGEKQSFTASTRNSVTSLAYGRWWGTYSFLRSGQPGQIDWNTTIATVAADYMAPITLVCPPAGQSAQGDVWGSDVYPDDSAICVAGVHAGAISLAGGALTVTRVTKQASFPAITRNNITSRVWSDPATRTPPRRCSGTASAGVSSPAGC